MPDRSVVYSFIGRFDSLNAGLTTAGRNVQELGTKLTALDKNGAKMRAGLDTLGRSAGRVGLVAAGGLAAAAKAAVDWESQWAGVMKTVDGTASQMDALEGSLRELARTMPATHEEIAATAEAAGQLGVAREDITDFTKVMIQLGETTDLSADAAATSIAQLMNVMGTSGDKVDEIGNTLVDLGNKGASTESQILAMAQRLSGVGTTVGATEADILGLASAMANLGIEADLGGGAVQRVMVGINTQVASGGEQLQAYADLAGMSADQFAQAWSESPVQAFDALLRGLGGVSESGGDVAAVLADLGIKGTQNLQVMLRLAGAGDELTNSLDQSNRAWEENSALFEEFGKRADTTAAEMQVAWNNVKDAGIDLGAATLPVLEKAASTVTTLAQGFQQLPGPVKSATTGLLGITAVLGGGLWFTSKVIGGIADTKQALSDLGITAGPTGSKLATIGKTAVGILAVATAAGALADEIGRIDAENLDRAMAALMRGEVTDEIKGVVDSLEEVTGFRNKIDLGEIFTLGGLAGDSSLDKFADNIDLMDQKLAQLVETGEEAQAADLFGMISELAEAKGVSPEDTAKKFDAYALALRNVKGSAEDTAGAQEALGPAGAAAAGGLSQSSAAAARAAERMKEARNAAREAAQGFITLGDSLNNPKKSLGDWMRDLEQQAAALRDFTKNAQTAARRGLDEGLIKSLNEAGPAGALRMKQLANATDAEIKRANKAWRDGQAAIREYVNMQVPPKEVRVDNKQALAALQRIKAEMSTIKDKTVRLTYYVNQVNAINKGGFEPNPDARGADGLTVPGRRQPYGDKVLAFLAPGEEVISNRYGQADRNRELLKAINANRLAYGGTVGVPEAGSSNSTGRIGPSSQLFGINRAWLSVAELAERISNLSAQQLKTLGDDLDKLSKKSLVKLSKALEQAAADAKEDLQELRSARSALASSVRDLITGGDLFTVNEPAMGGDLWWMNNQGLTREEIAQYRDEHNAQIAAGPSVSSNVDSLIRGGEERLRLIRKISGMGVDGAVLANLATQPIEVLRELASSRRDALRFERQYERLQQIGQQAGQFVGSAVYDKRIGVLADRVHEGNQELRAINKRLGKLEEVRDATEKGANKVAAAIKGEVGNGARGRR